MCRRIAAKPNWLKVLKPAPYPSTTIYRRAGVSTFDPNCEPAAGRRCLESTRKAPRRRARDGLLETEQDNCYTSAVVLAQLAYWVRSKEGRQRQALQAWLTRLMAALHGRVLSFNASGAYVWAEQQRELERAGRRMPIEDSYIAATARRYNLTIVTGNDRHFDLA